MEGKGEVGSEGKERNKGREGGRRERKEGRRGSEM
jgi:hypothetical protein